MGFEEVQKVHVLKTAVSLPPARKSKKTANGSVDETCFGAILRADLDETETAVTLIFQGVLRLLSRRNPPVHRGF